MTNRKKKAKKGWQE